MIALQKTKTVLAAAAISFVTMVGLEPSVNAAEYQKVVRLSAGKSAPGRRLTLGVNKSLVVEVPGGVRDVLVSNPKVADAVVRSARRVYVMAGEKPGQTNIFIFGKNGVQVGNLEITVELDTGELTRMMRSLVRGAGVRAKSINGSIVLTGEVASASEAQRAMDLAIRFVGDEKKVLSMMSIKGKEQVHLKVVVAEVQRSIVKQLGIDLEAFANVGELALGLLTENVFSVAGKTLNSSLAGIGYKGSQGSVKALIRAMEQDHLVKLLAEPTLTAISGESASFLVGGEFPVPVGRQDFDITIEFKPFGIGLDFTPVVLSSGRISLRIKSEVSEIDSEHAVQLNGGGNSGSALTIPGLKVRRAETTVELPSGGSMIMAGLIKDDVRQALNGTPGLMKLPVLGALFKSRDFQSSQTELVIFVTPYLVDPVARSALTSPDKNFAPPSDAAGFFLNRLNRMYRLTDSTEGTGRYHGRVGFIYE